MKTTNDFEYPQPLPPGLGWYLCPEKGCKANDGLIYQVGTWDEQCGVVRCECKHCRYCGDARRA